MILEVREIESHKGKHYVHFLNVGSLMVDISCRLSEHNLLIWEITDVWLVMLQAMLAKNLD